MKDKTRFLKSIVLMIYLLEFQATLHLYSIVTRQCPSAKKIIIINNHILLLNKLIASTQAKKLKSYNLNPKSQNLIEEPKMR